MKSRPPSATIRTAADVEDTNAFSIASVSGAGISLRARTGPVINRPRAVRSRSSSIGSATLTRERERVRVVGAVLSVTRARDRDSRCAGSGSVTRTRERAVCPGCEESVTRLRVDGFAVLSGTGTGAGARSSRSTVRTGSTHGIGRSSGRSAARKSCTYCAEISCDCMCAASITGTATCNHGPCVSSNR
ncbi:hypothetical protein QV65_32380 [Rhodococcus erythropolis]|nr:hypothetical protein QV65_32380 [Rhodococcus erythropolis]